MAKYETITNMTQKMKEAFPDAHLVIALSWDPTLANGDTTVRMHASDAFTVISSDLVGKLETPVPPVPLLPKNGEMLQVIAPDGVSAQACVPVPRWRWTAVHVVEG